MRRFLSLLFLSGCAVGPNYQTIVDVPPTENWIAPCDQQELAICCEEPECDWWANFDDEQLNRYITLASLYNYDILSAEANICMSRALKGEKIADYYPHINGDISALRYGYSKTGPLFFVENLADKGPFSPFVRVPFYQTLYTVMFDASWEIDLFGKIARNVEAAERIVESAVENLNDVLVSVFAETAKNYIEVRGAQRQYQLTKQNIAYLQKNLFLIEDRYRKGLSNELDVLRSKALLENQQALLHDYEAQIYAGIFSLSILTGQEPDALLQEMLPCKPLPLLLNEVCVGLKSDLLLRRPDVRKAERNLAEAVAEIGIAVADFFPSFSFLGSGGLQSLSLRQLFEARSFQWAYGFDFNFPIFQGGFLRAQLRAKEYSADQAAFEYHETVLRALRDAETTLVSYAEDLESIERLSQSVDNISKVRDLSYTRYTKGLTNLMDFLDRESDLIQAELNLATKETQSLIDLIALYKALGGGWQCQCPCED